MLESEFESNQHHIVRHANRRLWEVYDEGIELVQDPSLIARLELKSHEWINNNCPPVPALGYYSLSQTLKEWKTFLPTPDPLEGIENLFESLSRAQEHPKAYREERDLIDLVGRSIRKQMPPIRDGLVLG